MHARLALPALLLLAVGCDSSGTDAATDFGDAYRVDVEQGVTLARADGVGDLGVPVQYGGGCETHAFALRRETRGDTLDLWLRHDDGGDLCEASIEETIQIDNIPLGDAEVFALRIPDAPDGRGERRVLLF